MMDWSIIIQIVALVASAFGVFAAIKSSLDVMLANLVNLKEDHEELKVDFKEHVRNVHCHRRTDDL